MQRKKLLVADDNKLTHKLYADTLGEEFEIFHAYDGAEALMMALDLMPDLILLDIMMPLLDGRSVCRKLKSHPKTKHQKIVMVTAKESQSDRLVGFEVGADDYIEKSSSIDLVIRSVRKQLQ